MRAFFNLGMIIGEFFNSDEGGRPRTSVMELSTSDSVLPENRGKPVDNSASIQPSDQISILASYPDSKITSGAR